MTLDGFLEKIATDPVVPFEAVPGGDEWALVKLGALRQLARHLDMFNKSEPQSDDDWAIIGFCCVALLVERSPIRRAYIAAYLDMIAPAGWRGRIDKHILGTIVEREDTEVRQWRQAVLDRDGHACVECGAADSLEAHHIVRWVDAPMLRVVLANGKTLCWDCHLAAHGRSRVH